MQDSLGKLLRKLRGNESLRDAAEKAGLSHTYLSLLEKGFDPRSGKEIKPSAETLQKLAITYNYPYEKLLSAAGYLSHTETPEQRIEAAISDDAELSEFWQELAQRDDLQLLFKQVKPLPPEAIKRIIRYIKMVEDEEAQED